MLPQYAANGSMTRWVVLMLLLEAHKPSTPKEAAGHPPPQLIH